MIDENVLLDAICAEIIGDKTPARKPAAEVFKPKRTTALDVIEVWMHLPPEEDRRVLEAIGLKRILAAFPEAWRRDAAVSGWAPSWDPNWPQEDLPIPEFLQRKQPEGAA